MLRVSLRGYGPPAVIPRSAGVSPTLRGATSIAIAKIAVAVKRLIWFGHM